MDEGDLKQFLEILNVDETKWNNADAEVRRKLASRPLKVFWLTHHPDKINKDESKEEQIKKKKLYQFITGVYDKGKVFYHPHIKDDNSEDDKSEDDNSEDDNSEDDNSEDDNSEDDKSEDDNGEDDNSEDDNSEDEISLYDPDTGREYTTTLTAVWQTYFLSELSVVCDDGLGACERIKAFLLLAERLIPQAGADQKEIYQVDTGKTYRQYDGTCDYDGYRNYTEKPIFQSCSRFTCAAQKIERENQNKVVLKKEFLASLDHVIKNQPEVINFIINETDHWFYHDANIFQLLQLLPQALQAIASQLAQQETPLSPEKRIFFAELKQSPVFARYLIEQTLKQPQDKRGLCAAYQVICEKRDLGVRTRISKFFKQDSATLKEYKAAVAQQDKKRSPTPGMRK